MVFSIIILVIILGLIAVANAPTKAKRLESQPHDEPAPAAVDWQQFADAPLTGIEPPVSLSLQKGESLLYATAANAIGNVTHLQHIGGYSGVGASFRLARGFWLRTNTGGVRGHTERVSAPGIVGTGTIYLTDKRFIYVGEKTLSVPYAKIIAHEGFKDGLRLHFTGRMKPMAWITGDFMCYATLLKILIHLGLAHVPHPTTTSPIIIATH